MAANNRAPGFVLRLPPKLKRALAKVARNNHRHLYQEVTVAVERYVESFGQDDTPKETFGRIMAGGVRDNLSGSAA